MAKKLLSVNFSDTLGLYTYNLGANSSDNVALTPSGRWVLSSDRSLNQTSCGFQSNYGRSSYASALNQMQMHKILSNMGYGARICVIKDLGEINTPLYMFGTSHDVDGNPMPYVKYVTNGYGDPELHYFKADNTDLGYPFRMLFGSSEATCAFFAGQLYTDGTFNGQAGNMRPYMASTRKYQWTCTYDYSKRLYPDGVPLINANVIEDIQNYLPVEPEGEFTDEGEGDFDAKSDPIDFPALPTLSVLDTGMTQIYEMTTTQLQSLSNYLWTTDFVTNLAKMFSDPMEAILNLSIMPLDMTTGALTSAIRIGNITTSVNGQRINSQYKLINFGTINMREYWGDFADYSPYTKLSIFLPYVGVQSISIDDVMNGSIQLKGYCDVLTGSVQYVLKSNQGNHRGHGHNSILYTWGGNCQYQVPLNASNFSSVISSLISTTGTIAGAVGSTIATGGMTAPIAIGAVGSVMSNVMSAKTHVQRGGGLGGCVGLFGVQTPYLILERPEQINPKQYNETVGSPCECGDYLKNYSGFVKIKGVNLTINKATDKELNEIEGLLKEGVLI